jgi:hypothetical protein
LCVVDDAQWLDKASALTLSFVARRLLADPVGILLAAREPGEAFAHAPQLEVRGLVNGDADYAKASEGEDYRPGGLNFPALQARLLRGQVGRERIAVEEVRR